MVTSAVTQTVTPGSPYPNSGVAGASGYLTSNALDRIELKFSADGRSWCSSIFSDLVGDDSNGVEDVLVRATSSSGAYPPRQRHRRRHAGQRREPLPVDQRERPLRLVPVRGEQLLPGDGSDKDVRQGSSTAAPSCKCDHARRRQRALTSAELASLTLRSSLSADGRYVRFPPIARWRRAILNGRRRLRQVISPARWTWSAATLPTSPAITTASSPGDQRGRSLPSTTRRRATWFRTSPRTRRAIAFS